MLKITYVHTYRFYTRQPTDEFIAIQVGISVSHALALTSKILGVAKATGTSLKSYEVAVKHLEDAKEHSGPNTSLLGVYGAVRKESGLPYENQ